MFGIICDVGHTIITNSILNQILVDQGIEDAAVKLYDDQRLASKSQKLIDDWVRNASSYKLNSLRGVSVDEIENHCKIANFTPGFNSFIQFCIDESIPVLFIGAVPKFITKLLIKVQGVDVSSCDNIYVNGSSAQITDGVIQGALQICTPTVKLEYSKKWLDDNEIRHDELIVIGDSIGDIPVMQLADKENRFGIHVESSRLKNIISNEVNDFNELLSLIEKKLNISMVSEL